MPLDLMTLDGPGPPKTLDGRIYPEHLRQFDKYDQELLLIVKECAPMTAGELTRQVEDPRLRSVATRWIASAQWRGLVEAINPDQINPIYGAGRIYQLKPRGRLKLAES